MAELIEALPSAFVTAIIFTLCGVAVFVIVTGQRRAREKAREAREAQERQACERAEAEARRIESEKRWIADAPRREAEERKRRDEEEKRVAEKQRQQAELKEARRQAELRLMQQYDGYSRDQLHSEERRRGDEIQRLELKIQRLQKESDECQQLADECPGDRAPGEVWPGWSYRKEKSTIDGSIGEIEARITELEKELKRIAAALNQRSRGT